MEGKFLRHESCPKCGSKDNVGVYEYPDYILKVCYSPGCGYTEKVSKDEREVASSPSHPPLSTEFLSVEYISLQKRGIKQKTCEFWKYGVGSYRGEPVQVAQYYNSYGQLVGQKLRFQDKRFKWVGHPREAKLFGQNLWSGNGRRLVITEGEIDALSVSQAFSNNWQVVSVPNGAQGAAQAISKNLEWVESFDEIVIGFDNDEPGRKAIEHVVQVLTPGKVKVINWHPYKDANEVLLAEGEKGIRNRVYAAEIYRPDGVKLGKDITLEYLLQDSTAKSYDLPWPQLNYLMKGLRKGELTLLTAGSGVGKSTFARELAYHLLTKYPHLRIGYIALEENIRKTAISLIALDNNIPAGDLYMNPQILTIDKFKKSYEKLIANDRLILYDHFGSLDENNLINKIRYMALGMGIDFLFLDHISIVVSGIEEGDERRKIDNLMTKLRALIENTGIGCVAISHLKVINHGGKAHEEGGKISINDLRGSGSLKQLSDNILAIELPEANKPVLKLLKNRMFGQTGYADTLSYNPETGRISVEGDIFQIYEDDDNDAIIEEGVDLNAGDN